MNASIIQIATEASGENAVVRSMLVRSDPHRGTNYFSIDLLVSFSLPCQLPDGNGYRENPMFGRRSQNTSCHLSKHSPTFCKIKSQSGAVQSSKPVNNKLHLLGIHFCIETIASSRDW